MFLPLSTLRLSSTLFSVLSSVPLGISSELAGGVGEATILAGGAPLVEVLVEPLVEPLVDAFLSVRCQDYVYKIKVNDSKIQSARCG